MYVYDRNFYLGQSKGSKMSAEEVVPLVMNLTVPKSVIDVGCGIGTWLKTFSENGVSNIQGIDGSYVNKEMLLIPLSKFLQIDLENPIKFESKYDLVVSLEVAEHLKEANSDSFVELLVNLGDIILFSAAVPHQGGANHLNEQLIDYWVEKFNKRGFVLIDALRSKIWNNTQIEFWYRQNIVFFVKKEILYLNPVLNEEYLNSNYKIASIMHPEFVNSLVNKPPSFLQLIAYAKKYFSNCTFVLLLKKLTKKVRISITRK